MQLREHLPTAATLGNAAAGVAACGFAVTGNWELGALMILVAVLMDSLDGALARVLGASSDFGMELDSLADVISFGCAPAVLVGSLLPVGAENVGWPMVTVYALCAVWRLARFNARRTEAELREDFVGLPTTGAGAAAATAVLLYLRLPSQGVPLAEVFLPWVLVLLGMLMISRIGYKHGATIVSRLNPALAVLTAGVFVAGSVLWQYEYMFAALMWGYTLSGPLGAAREKIRAVRHA